MKKLKINKTMSLAKRMISEPHWHFTKGEVIETDDQYLIKRLTDLKVAKELKGDEDMKMKQEDIMDDSKNKKEKMKEDHLNKKMEAPQNKAYFLDKKGRLAKDD